MENCAELDLNGDCKICQDGKLMEEGKCLSKSCDISDCILCSNYYGSPQCELCKPNFVVYPYNSNDKVYTKCI